MIHFTFLIVNTTQILTPIMPTHASIGVLSLSALSILEPAESYIL